MCDAVETQAYDATQAAADMQVGCPVIEIDDSLPMGSPSGSGVCRSLARDFSKANLEEQITGFFVSKECCVFKLCVPCFFYILILATNCP